jgi:hypothetical protein
MLVRTEKTKTVEDFLKTNLLINLNIFGIMENKPEAEIFVDNVEIPKGVLVREGYFSFLYSKDEAFIDEVLNTYGKEGYYGFSGIEKSIAEKIKKRFKKDWENPCTLYYLPESNLDLSLIKNEVKKINIKDAEIVDNFYTYRGLNSLNAIKEDISKRPSSAVYNNGEIVCWVLTHDDNSLGIMYTKEEHRHKGYAVDVTVDIAHHHVKNGKIPYLQIVKGNNMSPGLAKKCGFVECGEVSWLGIKVGN